MTENISLQQKLEQYSTTARSQITYSLSAAEIAGYAAAGAAMAMAMAMAGAADAAIIYSGIQNISVQINPKAVATGNAFATYASTAIDIDGGGADINAIAMLRGHVTVPNTVKYLHGSYRNGAGFTVPSKGGALLLQAPTNRWAANLPLSFTVGPGGSFGNGSAFRGNGIIRFGFFNFAAVLLGNFAIGVTGFAGIQLTSGNYGWIRLRIDDLGPNRPFGGIVSSGLGLPDPDKVTIIDWAYDDSGAPIHVADTSSLIPEPSSLVLLASGAAGIAAFRRRKAERRV